MSYRFSPVVFCAVLAVWASQAGAQESASGQIAQNREDGRQTVLDEPINNGTDPTRLSTIAGVQYQYNDIVTGLSSGLWEAFFTTPIGARKNMALQLKLAYGSSAFDNDYDFGDFSLRFTHVVDVNAQRGIAYSAELFFDTAARADLGYGKEVLELSAFYAFFNPNKSIFAPALVQTFGLDGRNANGRGVNQTTIDFYYVPKLANPKFFMTLDPALSYDWETEKGFASLQVTFGMLTGKAFGGDGQIFIKPGIYAGADRPLDYSLQVGYKVLNF